MSFSDADKVVVPDIYFVRDTETEKYLVNSEILVNRILENGTMAKYIKDFDSIVAYLAKNVKPGSLVLTIGAGPIYEVGLKLKEALTQ